MGDGFSLVTYESHKIMELLFYLFYTDVDAQSKCGAGSAVSGWDNNSHLNGCVQDTITNLTDTTASNNPTNNHFLGLCDWWGNVYEWIDNLVIIGYNEEQVDGDTITNITVGIQDTNGNVVRTVTVPYTDGCQFGKLWGAYADVFPTKYDDGVDDNGVSGYTVSGCVNDIFGYVASRSGSSASSDYGVGYLYVGTYPSHASSSFGSRLQYRGPVAMVDDLELSV